jgi:Domain of unknown function (DUF3291)
MNHLAQFDIVSPRGPRSDPRMADFYDATDYVNGLAESHPGFIWREREEDSEQAQKLWGAGILYTLSVWKDVESLKHFMYKTPHLKFLHRGPEWFLPIDQPRVVLWHIGADRLPTLAEASAKLRHLRAHGSTAEAFDLRTSFAPALTAA